LREITLLPKSFEVTVFVGLNEDNILSDNNYNTDGYL